ncbi:MAG: SUMF1/EgtB/PvdO family nonheme iron enzyme [Candidatus Eisenbacteria bacterium]
MRTIRGSAAVVLMFVLIVLALSCSKDSCENPDTAPAASFTVTPASGTTLTVFQFDASACSDAEDPTPSLQVRWDWYNDGTWDTEWSTTKTASVQFGTIGINTMALEVRDTGGLTDTATRQVTVESQNTAPTASFNVTPTTGTTDTVFQFDASSCSDVEDPISALQVRWDWENDGTWDTGWSAIKTAIYQYGTPGSKKIKLEVKDTGGLTGESRRTVAVGIPFETPEMVLVPAGTFTMGDGVAYCGVDEHEVTLSHSFYLGKYEVTNKEYRDALQWADDNNYVTATSSAVNDNLDESTALLVHLAESDCQISFSGGVFTVASGKEDYPMVNVSWYGAAAYCDWLNMSQGLARVYNHSTWQCNSGDPYGASGYRLPTDAEWEYATQYGGERIYPWGNESPDCSRANYSGCVGSTAPVGSYPAAPASLGLYDMAGNVWELCNDWHTCDLGTGPVADPKGPPSGSYRVLRGESWYDDGGSLQCAARNSYLPSTTSSFNGFRCARSQ